MHRPSITSIHLYNWAQFALIIQPLQSFGGFLYIFSSHLVNCCCFEWLDLAPFYITERLLLLLFFFLDEIIHLFNVFIFFKCNDCWCNFKQVANYRHFVHMGLNSLIGVDLHKGHK